MCKSAVNDNAEDFPKVAVDMQLFGVKFVSTSVDCGDQSLVPNIGEDARTKDDVKEFQYSQLEYVVCIWVGGFLFCNLFKVIGESSGFWQSSIVDYKICI